MADITKSIPHILEQLILDVGIESVTVHTVAVTVPSITDPDIGQVAETVAGVAVGDIVFATPDTALMTNARFQNVYVTATDTVNFVFGSEGGNVTGADEAFTLIVLHRS